MKYSKRTLLTLLFVAPLALTGCFKDTDVKDIADGGSGSGSGGAANYTSSLLAYYTFDNQTANDLTENRVHASTFNEARFEASGSHNGSYYLLLSGVHESYMCIPMNLFSGRSQWTVSFWIKDLTAGKIFAAQEAVNGGGYYDAPVFGANQSGMLQFKNSYGNSDGYYSIINYNYVNSSTEWHHWALVVSPAGNNSYTSNVKLYVDGVLRSNVNTDYNSSAVASCTQIMFGGNGWATSASMKLDDLRIYGRALEAKDIDALYNAER